MGTLHLRRSRSKKMSTTAGLSREKLEGEERERRLREEVPFWQQVSCRDAIQRTFTFKDFKEAWRFMNLTAEKAEEMDHHRVVQRVQPCGGDAGHAHLQGRVRVRRGAGQGDG